MNKYRITTSVGAHSKLWSAEIRKDDEYIVTELGSTKEEAIEKAKTTARFIIEGGEQRETIELDSLN